MTTFASTNDEYVAADPSDGPAGLPVAGIAATSLFQTQPSELRGSLVGTTGAFGVIRVRLQSPPPSLSGDWEPAQVAPQASGATSLEAARKLPAWFDYVLNRLVDIVNPTTDIDGFPRPSKGIVGQAFYEASELFPAWVKPPSVVPTREAGVKFVWHDQGWDVEIGIDPGDHWLWVRNRNDGRSFDGSLNEGRVLLAEFLRASSAES